MGEPKSIAALRELIPDFAKDIRLNLGSILNEEGAPGLSLKQISGVALTTAWTLKDATVIQALLESARETLSEAEITATKTAATLMAVTNIYYRTLHLADDPELKKLPARLRMNGIATHGIEKVDFELFALGASVIGGCSSCINAHIHESRKGGISNEGIQSVIRIASVINGTSQALNISKI